MVETLKEVTVQADEAMISMVRDYAQNVDIIFGRAGLLSTHTKGKTIIVMSTFDPNATKLSRFSTVSAPMQSHLHFMSWGG